MHEILSSDIRLIQSSPMRTGSTLLTNILYGLFCFDSSVYFSSQIGGNLKNNFIIKTHNMNFDVIEKNNKNYKIFFICSERPEISEIIPTECRSRDNVIIFDYSTELLENENLSLDQIVSNVILKINTKIPKDIMNLHNYNMAIKRILIMNNLYETIKHKSFNYFDKHFHIHGSHRNRKK